MMKIAGKHADMFPGIKTREDNFPDIIKSENLNDILCISGSFFYLILDVTNQTYQYVSPWIKHVLGFSQDFFLEKGASMMANICHPEIANTQKAIYEECARFLQGKSLKYKPYYKFSFDLQVRDINGNYVRLLQHNRYIKYNSDGKPLLLLSIFMKLPPSKDEIKQTLCISRMMPQGEKILHKIDFYPQFENGILTKTEIEVWSLTVDGLSGKEIAKKLGIKVNTVNTHRKNIYKKLKNTGMQN